MTLPNEQSPADEQSPAAASDLSELQAALAAAEARALESKDLYMRALAEIENVRKRAARDIEQAHKYALDKFAADLIEVRDSLELGLAAEGAVDTLRGGIEATLKLLTRAFEKAGVFEVDPQGQPFNPELHEAMAAQPSSEQDPNTVLQVVQKGYQLNGRLIRPARVIVAREP